MNYCYFIVQVQIRPKLTIGAVLSVETAIRPQGLQKDKFIFIFVFVSL